MTTTGLALIGSYNYGLVAVSVLTSILTSYAALDLAGRTTSSHGGSRLSWTAGGATAMGLGIWSMHYVGMLAFRLPIPVQYDWPTVLLSLFAAILASAVTLLVVSQRSMSLGVAVVGSIFMGGGIAAMHYVGMTAMRMSAMCHFSPALVILSVILAVVISFVAILLSFRLREDKSPWCWRKLTGALIMGLAIPVMHYTGMAAVSFMPTHDTPAMPHALGISSLGVTGIVIVTFIVLGVVLVTSFADRRFSSQAVELRSSENRYRHIIETTLDAFVEVDLSGSITDWSTQAEATFGWRRSEIVGQSISRIIILDRNSKPVADGLRDFLGFEEGVLQRKRLEMTALYKDQREFPVELTISAIVLGEAHLFATFVHDVSVRKHEHQLLTTALHESETIARERAELGNMADLLQSCETVTEACKVAESVLPPIFEFCPGMLYLTNSSRNLIENVATWNGCSTSEEAFDPNDCWALRLGKPYDGGVPSSPLRCSHVRPNLTGDYLCVPLVAQGETLGVLYLEDKRSSLAPIDTRMDLREHLRRRSVAVAERLSLSLANLKLREMLRAQSIRDALTGLFNRRYFEESLNRELSRAGRMHRPVSLVMIDLDHFKQFNDTFGHQAGDMLLREVASVFKTRIRAGDLACRFGGEEFAIIVADSDTQGARICIESVRDAIGALDLHHHGQFLGSVTVSAGIASFPIHGGNPEDLIASADQALYKAKKAGRDCVVMCETPGTVQLAPAI
jgi:diguanylate cyclase (GGDEF)-like protein/PAS domain S-box-containing protein